MFFKGQGSAYMSVINKYINWIIKTPTVGLEPTTIKLRA